MKTQTVFVALAFAGAAWGQIDPSIPLRIISPRIPTGPNPMDMARQILEMRELQERARLEEQMRLQAQEQRDAAARQQAEQRAAQAPAPQQAPPVDPQRIFTQGMANGRAWAVMPQEARIVYVVAVKDAIIASAPPDAAQFLASDFTVNEVIKAIDKLYEQPENATMPITYALRLSVMKSRGMSPADFETTSAAIRKALASPPQTQVSQ